MKGDFRDRAREAVKRARTELASAADERLIYAALELRLAMEALTYDRALAYKAEIPPTELETWQPRKVLQMLLDIDPKADKSSTLGVGVEEGYGEPAPDLKALGAESVLDLATLKKHYDAVGSYLHMPTLKQMNEGKYLDADKLRGRCEEIAEVLANVLDSSVFNVTLGSFATVECARCKRKIRKRLPHVGRPVEAKCFECGAEYRIHDLGDDSVRWEPIQQEVKCPLSGCNAGVFLWRDQINVGAGWTCEGCGEVFTIVLGLAKKDVGQGTG